MKRFSIILPVRNGGEHVKLCVASALAQTLENEFELLVLENASSDGTAEWLGALRDERVKIIPADHPLSIEDNWRRILRVPRVEFMTLIGHDDLLDPNYLEVIQKLIEQNPQAGLYQTHFRNIDDRGEVIEPSRPVPARESCAEFLAVRLCEIRDSYGTGYVMRSRDYDRVGGMPAFAKLHHADDALWLRLIADTWKAAALEICFSYRRHSQSAGATSSKDVQLESLLQHYDFLAELARAQPDVNTVMQRYGSKYFSTKCRYLHRCFLEDQLRGRASYPDEKRERLRLLEFRACGESNRDNAPGMRRITALEWLDGAAAPGRWAFAALDAAEHLLRK